ncbi:MAG: porin family protein [Methylococcaceae bacterium]|nr:porin family protein [Methylococcaceae bacterium]
MAAADGTDDFDRPGTYLGLGGTYAFHWFAGSSFDRNLGGQGVQVISSSSGGLNARAGYRVNPWFAAEAEYEWIDGFTNKIQGSNVATLTSHQLTVNGKFIYSDWGRFQPYGLLGVGLSIWEASDRAGRGSGLEGTSVGLAGRVGLGLDAYVNKNLLVNLGLDMALSTTTIDNSIGGDLRNLFYVPIQLGVQYRF